MALFDKILVPVDGSRPSAVGAALAVELAKQYAGKLVFANIVDIRGPVSTLEWEAVDTSRIAEEGRAEGERLVGEAVKSARAAGLEAEGMVLEGPVLDLLLETALDAGATAIVIGSHGRSSLARLLMGSTTDGLLRRSPVPVIVAPRGTPRNVPA